MATKCIDISAWQGNVPVKVFMSIHDSIPYVIIRTSYTKQESFDMYEDKCFGDNFKAAYKANAKTGAYHYSQAISESEAKKEAEFTVKILKKYEKKYGVKITLPVAFDWEFGRRLNSYVAGKLGKRKCKQICDAYCRVIRANGYQPMVYANLSTLNGFIASDIYKYWPIWVAQYHSRCDYKHPYYMWQYSSSGHVAGISGRVDMNYLYGGVSSEPKAETTCPYKLPKIPKRGWFTSGDKGEEVQKLQRFLNWYGDYGLVIDGEVGRKTMWAVRYYQGREKIKPIDGLFGPKCLERAKVVKR